MMMLMRLTECNADGGDAQRSEGEKPEGSKKSDASASSWATL